MQIDPPAVRSQSQGARVWFLPQVGLAGYAERFQAGRALFTDRNGGQSDCRQRSLHDSHPQDCLVLRRPAPAKSGSGNGDSPNGKTPFFFVTTKLTWITWRRLGFRHVFYQPFGASFGPHSPGIAGGEYHAGTTYVGSILGEVEILNRWLFTPYMPQLIPILQQAGEEIAQGRWGVRT